MILAIFVDPPRIAFHVPFIQYPIAWYGVFFAFGFWLALRLFSLLCDWRPFTTLPGSYLSEKIVNYMMVGIVFGARLFHIVFYEPLDATMQDPWKLFRFWEGGLASHGGILCSVLATLAFVRHYRVPFFKLIDRIFPCGMLMGGCIRLGNFMNQEILGLKTLLPWGVVFQNPQSHMEYGIYPRHPVQIYESLFYFLLAILGLALLKKDARVGVVAFLLTIAMSLGRFFVEFIKEDQSVHTVGLYLNMGQILSLPMLLVGLVGLAFALNNRLKEPFATRIS